MKPVRRADDVGAIVERERICSCKRPFLQTAINPDGSWETATKYPQSVSWVPLRCARCERKDLHATRP